MRWESMSPISPVPASFFTCRQPRRGRPSPGSAGRGSGAAVPMSPRSTRCFMYRIAGTKRYVNAVMWRTLAARPRDRASPARPRGSAPAASRTSRALPAAVAAVAIGGCSEVGRGDDDGVDAVVADGLLVVGEAGADAGLLRRRASSVARSLSHRATTFACGASASPGRWLASAIWPVPMMATPICDMRRTLSGVRLARICPPPYHRPSFDNRGPKPPWRTRFWWPTSWPTRGWSSSSSPGIAFDVKVGLKEDELAAAVRRVRRADRPLGREGDRQGAGEPRQAQGDRPRRRRRGQHRPRRRHRQGHPRPQHRRGLHALHRRARAGADDVSLARKIPAATRAPQVRRARVEEAQRLPGHAARRQDARRRRAWAASGAPSPAARSRWR